MEACAKSDEFVIWDIGYCHFLFLSLACVTTVLFYKWGHNYIYSTHKLVATANDTNETKKHKWINGVIYLFIYLF